MIIDHCCFEVLRELLWVVLICIHLVTFYLSTPKTARKGDTDKFWVMRIKHEWQQRQQSISTEEENYYKILEGLVFLPRIFSSVRKTSHLYSTLRHIFKLWLLHGNSWRWKFDRITGPTCEYAPLYWVLTHILYRGGSAVDRLCAGGLSHCPTIWPPHLPAVTKNIFKKKYFLDALAPLAFKLSVSESITIKLSL